MGRRRYSQNSRLLSAVVAVNALLLFAPVSNAVPTRDECDRTFGVRIGNEGKDVIWVPSNDRLVTAMLQSAQVDTNDYVIDLGAGDGKIPIAAAKQFGARSLGIEYDEKMVRIAKCYVDAEGLSDRVEIRQADIFKTDLSRATVVTLYLLPKLNRKLRPNLLALEPGTRVVSNRFKMGAWEPDEIINVEGVANTAYLWIVPANVAGTWNFVDHAGEAAFRVRFSQEFQKLRASVVRPRTARVRDVVLRGKTIQLQFVNRDAQTTLRGSVDDSGMMLSTSDGVTYTGRKL